MLIPNVNTFYEVLKSVIWQWREGGIVRDNLSDEVQLKWEEMEINFSSGNNMYKDKNLMAKL